MPGEFLNTKEAARYLEIHEKQVYALIKAGKIPATRVTGKWIFPKRLLDEWIESTARDSLKKARKKSGRVEGALLASGSNDPVLDFLMTALRRDHPEFIIFSSNTGSTQGLRALGDGYTDIAWSHLLDPQSGEYNKPFLSALEEISPVLIHLFRRSVGLVVGPGNPSGIRGFEDLVRGDVRFINRQRGSGTRKLLDYHLERLGLDREKIAGYKDEAFTHMEVGLAVLSGEADAGLASVAISHLLGVGFIPVARESFDMIVGRSTFFEKGVQALIETLRSDKFRRKMIGLADYGFEDTGKILYSAV
ncbi:MAG: substrate-binding domain-containing protein [Syntrophales bacterium]|nr:substrate-binding domain-containing protein [Syntrophales bacterium]